jgi:hypothetical protein
MLVIIGAFSYQFLYLQEKHIAEEDKAKATLVTEIIKNGLITIMLKGKAEDFHLFLEHLIAQDIHSVRIFRPDGTVISSSNPSEIGTKFNISWDAEKPLTPELFSREINGRHIYCIRMPIYNEKPCQRCHNSSKEVMSILSVEMSMEGTLKKIRNLREKTVFLYLLTLFTLTVSVGVLTTFLINRPLKRIISTIKKVEDGDLNVRFDTSRKDEIGSLAKSLNSMLNELNKARHELESCQIEAMQKVEKMATIGELASAIAHEIKNPLAGISGAIQVFAEDFPPDDPRRDIIQEVLSEIERLDKAVRDLLSFAKPPEPHFMRTPIMPIIERAKRLILPKAKKQGIDVNIITADDIGEINVDPEQMQQVFLNIMLNALHSMPGGGTLTITTYLRKDKGEAEIAITDTGQGIAYENLKNIFKPFFTTKHTGTGLGLAISKNIVEKHGGRIEVESQIGTGSTFRVILPLEVKNV